MTPHLFPRAAGRLGALALAALVAGAVFAQSPAPSEARPDGVDYVAMQEGRKESAFGLSEQSVDRAEGRNDEIFTFIDAALEFPQKITYRRASEGWLYAVVEGKSKGVDRQVTYPMRRIGCESGEFIRR
jgi:hypothetical protein